MSVRTTIDIPDELHAELLQRAAAEHTSIRSLITGAIKSKYRQQTSRPVKGPLVGKNGKPGAGSPDRENPFDVLFVTQCARGLATAFERAPQRVVLL